MREGSGKIDEEHRRGKLFKDAEKRETEPEEERKTDNAMIIKKTHGGTARAIVLEQEKA